MSRSLRTGPRTGSRESSGTPRAQRGSFRRRRSSVERWPEEVMRVNPLEVGRWTGLADRFREPQTRPHRIWAISYIRPAPQEHQRIMIEHQAALNTIVDINRRFGVTSEDRIFGLSSLTFDLFVYDIFGAFAAGAALVLPDDAGRRDPSHWMPLLEGHGVTVWNTVPALMAMLVEFVERSRPPRFPAGLRLALYVRRLDPPDASRPDSGPGTRDGNRGAGRRDRSVDMVQTGSISLTSRRNGPRSLRLPRSPTSNTMCSMARGSPAIGSKAISILAERASPVVIGTTTRRQTRASSNRRTAKYSTRLATGKVLARRNAPFSSGRKDSQVKIGGHRVELGEIDAALGEVAGIGSAVSDIQTVDGQKRVVSALKIDQVTGEIERCIPPGARITVCGVPQAPCTASRR